MFAGALARQQADRAVRESEERFRRMADSAPMMVWLSGRDGRRTYVNQRWLDFTGRGLDHELGENWMADVHPRTTGRIWPGPWPARSRRGAPFTVEYRLRRQDREYRWVLDHGVPRRADDGDPAWATWARPSTSPSSGPPSGRSSRPTSSGAPSSGRCTVTWRRSTRAGRIIAVNHAWSRFAVENGGDPIRVSIGASYLDVCQDAAGARGSRRGPDPGSPAHRARRGARRSRSSTRAARPAGERWFEMTAEPLRRPEGGALVTHVDITRRRPAEEAAARQRDDLAHVLRVTTLSELATSLAHEISQPLTAIKANARAARRFLASGQPVSEESRRSLGDIVESADRASLVIDRFVRCFASSAWSGARWT